MSSNPRDDATILALRERSFAADLSKVPCSTSEDASRFVVFACRCVQQTPLEGGLTPLVLLRGHPVLHAGVALADRWASGEAVSSEQLQEAQENSFSAAQSAAGSTNLVKMSGFPAACWAAANLVEAAAEAAESENDVARANEAAAAAGRAARYARLAGKTLSHETIEYQESLFASIFGPTGTATPQG
jgi:hypothetical protein